MAKKNKSASHSLSPKQYIKEKVRNLPIGECSINNNWSASGEAVIIIPRIHKQGTYTVGTYLIDTFCRGLVYSAYHFNIQEEEYKKIFEHIKDNRVVVDYAEAHNLIYGAIAFAEEVEIKPDKSFELTKYILEEDTEDIPLIEYEYGKDGKYFLFTDTRLEASKYLPSLRKNLGDNFEFLLSEDAYIEHDRFGNIMDNDEEASGFEKAELLAHMTQLMHDSRSIPLTDYTYSHPKYPTVLYTENQHLMTLLFDPKNSNGLSEADIAEVLSYPRASLIRDLEQIALFETGCTCDDIPEERLNDTFYSPMMHILMFLGEVNGENSLDVVLETLRQNSSYCDFHFGDTMNELYVPTLYLLGQNKLQTLLDFAKEPGLYTFAHYMVFPAVAMIALRHPERRQEIIEWFRQVLLFYTENIAGNDCCDGALAGMIMSDLLDLHAIELLPEIKMLYDTQLVDKGCCGDYNDVKKGLDHMTSPTSSEYPLNIYERYDLFKKHWG